MSNSEKTILFTRHDKNFVTAFESGLDRNEKAPYLHFYDVLKNAVDILKGSAYLWFDDGTFYSNIFSKTKSIHEVFTTEIKCNESNNIQRLKNRISADASMYQSQVKAGNGKAYHVLHVATKIIKKTEAKRRITAKDVYSIMCSSVKDYAAPAKSDEKAFFDPKSTTDQKVRVNLFGMTSDNPVTSTPYIDELVIVNETILGHLLHPGKIFRFITETDTTIYSNTIGIGNAQFLSDGAHVVFKFLHVSERYKMLDKPLDYIDNNFLDNVIGARIFKNQDINLKKEVQRQYL